MSHCVLVKLLLLCLCLFKMCKATEQNFDWSLVKPMHLVSLYPPPLPNNQKPSKASLSPMFVNLESAIPVNDEVDTVDGAPEAMDRIFGGVEVETTCIPYQVGLLLQRPKGLYWCGGSLLSDQYVLTAAHCVDMAKRALVFLGANEIKNAKEKGQIRLMVHRESFLIYPTWNPRRLKDDIALIKLPESIEFTERIHPIQLPKRSYEYRAFRNKLGIASGWGRYSSGVRAISGVLRAVKLQIIDGKTCKRTFPLSYRGTNICTSGVLSKSTCSGDSGGPLVLRRKNTKRRVLVGITSFGSVFGCDRGYPAAFTKVAAYLDWISDETGIEPLQETTNAMLFNQYLKEYQNKQRLKLANNDDKDEFENNNDDSFKSNIDYDLFIL